MPQVSPYPEQRQVRHLRLVREEASPPYDAGVPTVRREAFAMIPSCAFERLKGDGYALAVYAALAKHADKDGVCWPSVRSLMEQTGWSESTIKRTIKRLVASGLISVVPRTTELGDADSNRYTLTHHPLRGGSPQNPPPSPQNPRWVPSEPRGGFSQNPELYPVEPDPKELGDTPHTPRARKATSLDGFEEFYAAYPKHKSRDSAERAWAKLKPDDELRRTIMAAVEAQKRTWDWQKEGGRYVPYPASWLNGRKWTDEVTTEEAPATTGRAGNPIDEWAARKRAELGLNGSVVETTGRVIR